MEDSILSKEEAIRIAEEYRVKYKDKLEGKVIKYEFVSARYLENWNEYCTTPVWAIHYDTDGWTDMWHDIVVSDFDGCVVCCSCWQSEAYYPHLK